MPTVGVNRDELFSALGQKYTEEEFDELCFEFGLELDEVVVDDNDDQTVTYKIDIGANRYDLLCLEGIARNLLIFKGKMVEPKYTITQKHPNQLEKMTVDQSTAGIRPHCVAAILRNVALNANSYANFIDLQDKLHQNIARKRSLVAIGTHDLDTIQGPFQYVAKPPRDIKFVPLSQKEEFNAEELMTLYSGESHLKQYLGIIRDSPVYPVIYDSRGVVLSMPPIINGNHSKITLDTKNILIECTATDLTKAKIVLDTIVTMFSQYCEKPFEIEPVEVIHSDGKSNVYPTLRYRSEIVEVSKVNGLVGTDLNAEEISELLTRMCLTSKPVDGGRRVEVTIPPTRHDILHACDIYEDVAIAYGYNNLTKTIPKMMTIAKQLPVNKLSDQLREQVAQSGFTECLSFSLCSRDDISTRLRHDESLKNAVRISNPKTLEFQVARTTLLPGLLKTIGSNKNMPLPLKLFEISDVVLKDPCTDVGARNERRLAAVYYNKSPGFETIHGLLDRLMTILDVPHCSSATAKESNLGYYIKGSDDDPTYFPGRGAQIIAFGKAIGRLGVLHPEVLAKFDLNLPISAMEINLELFL